MSGSACHADYHGGLTGQDNVGVPLDVLPLHVLEAVSKGRLALKPRDLEVLPGTSV